MTKTIKFTVFLRRASFAPGSPIVCCTTNHPTFYEPLRESGIASCLGAVRVGSLNVTHYETRHADREIEIEGEADCSPFERPRES